MLYCERCCEDISDERCLFEYMDFMICEECLELLLNAPVEMDEEDELVELMNNMDTE